jgi:hypothetical protein
MRIKLHERWIEKLRNLPETGMGYQRVDLRLANDLELHGLLVFNAEEIDVPDEFAHLQITDVRLHD